MCPVDSTSSNAVPDSDDFRAFQARVKNTNINEATLLATDYLNHFNEIIMLLEMVPDMPDCLEDAKTWVPKSYQEHMAESTFSDRELAVEAYNHVPPRYREPFEDIIGKAHRLVAVTTERADGVIAAGEMDRLRLIVTDGSRGVQKLMDMAGAIIHGSESTMDQSEIDSLLEQH